MFSLFFMKRVVRRLVAEYVRKIVISRVVEVSLDETIDVQMSLSNSIDDDIFYLLEIRNIREKFEKGFSKLTKRERKNWLFK